MAIPRRLQALILALVIPVVLNTLSAQKTPDLIDYKLFDDFETGELYGWEAYPYAQDIGFDALYFARSSPTYQKSKYALARPIKASDATELYQGFTKRLNFYTVPDTRIKAAIYFQSDRAPHQLEVSLGTFDGKRYFHTIQNPAANEWVEIDIPISALKMNGQSLPAGEHIQVVTLKADYPMVYYLYTYTILMDNFSINGERQRRFTAQSPSSVNFDMFDVSVLNKHYFYGDVISLVTSPEEKLPLQQVKGTLIDSRGKVLRDNIIFKKQGDAWANESIYRVAQKDATGQWQIQLNGQTAKGTVVNWAFKFLVPGKPVSGHPRLYFTREELKNRLATEKSPVAKKILDKALEDTRFMTVNVDSIVEGEDKTGDNLIGGPYSKTAVGFNAYGMWMNPMQALGRVIHDGSFRYAFTQDAAAGEQAKKALLKLCSFSKWNANWMLDRKFWTYYPVGYTLTPIAIGYDMLNDLLSADERAFVRDAIMKKGLNLFHRDMVEMNRMPSNLTNHIAVIVAGYGLAATAIYGDDPANPYLEPNISGILTKAKAFIDHTYYEDGSYGEPKSGYMDMATKDLVELIDVIERNFGVDYSTTTNVENFYKYPLHASHPNGLIQSYGDGGRSYSGFTQEHAEWFVKRTGNPYLYHFVKPYWESGKGGYLGYLRFRDDIKPASRDRLPVSKVFSAQGMVMRSGWDSASSIITTRVGPNSNHYHYDQGSFQVMTNGYELLADPGIGSLGYYANLDYLIYDIQAIGHNVMLVDHDPESQAPAHYDNGIAALKEWPRLTHAFAGRLADASEADLAGVYKDKLESYRRTLLYTKSGPLFIFDQVKSKDGQTHVFDWLFHAPQNDDNKRALTYADNRMVVTRPGARLTLDVLSPEIASAPIRDRYDKKFPESFISLTSKPALAAANFLAVAWPEAKQGADFGDMPSTKRINADGWIGASAQKAGQYYLGMFRTGESGAATVEGFTTDAKRFTASMDQQQHAKDIYFEGSHFSGHGVTLKATAPLTLAMSTTNGTIIETESRQPTTLTISLPGAPTAITLDGTPLRGSRYNSADKTLSVAIPAGHHVFSL